MNALKKNPQHLPGAFLRLLITAVAAFFLAAPLAVGAAEATPAPALAAGDVPPDYVGKTLDGVPIKLSGQAGKVIVVSYWATWCPYCLKELPILDNLQKLAGKEHMYVLGVNTEERAVFRKVLGAVSKMNMHFAYDPDGAAQKAYGVKGIPHMVIIGRDGKIIRVYRGYGEDMLDQIVAEINTALAAPVAGAGPAPVQGAAQ
ncbi:TlpA family protein disulfide reductase [Massilia sp. Dwa41.01b]|uniref:TlpA family protein disulfide reductase n=1 Tax=Massilia sp. Dwa41.01b TaxID=2709302 RepID=UPI0016005937|nr:TlpA disulfide reductase family protein [Massilia sp. Dwa41.01b]QNA88650.1 TlpA family protein disulfide reductase [Massilia sp. Dwa41.01b]